MSGSVFTLRETHASDINTQEAVGAIEAQRTIEALRTEGVTIELAWLRFCELNTKFGRHSPAPRAFLLEAFKRCAAV